MVTYYFSDGCKISTGFLGPTHTEKNPIISSLTAATGIISHSVFQYLETCMLQTLKKKKKKRHFIQAKIWLSQAYDYSLACSYSLTGPEKYLNFQYLENLEKYLNL